MSKGLGKRQTQILDALQADPAGWIELRALATTRSEYNSLHRAAYQLADGGLVAIDHRVGHGLTVCRLGVNPVNTDKWRKFNTPIRNGATIRKR